MRNDDQVPSGYANQGRHAITGPVALGDTTMPPAWYDAPEYKSYNKVPAYYPITAILGGAAESIVEGTTLLRPEPFLLQRITWATGADILTNEQIESIGGIFASLNFPTYSMQARSVELTWGDEFTRFMGKQPALVAAIFGDSYGYLDLPAPIFFQGSQTLQVNLRRLFWPFSIPAIPLDILEVDTQWDFVFEGVALLPMGLNQSGSE